MAEIDLRIALVGNPNCGKTALFNLLTGGRQKVANYAGVTVERKEGRFTTPAGRLVRVLDLPGAYSFDAASPDEQITRKVLAGEHPGEKLPDLIVFVADATNLRLHLRLLLEVRRLGRPMVVALNMMDAARARGIDIDVARLQARLGVPVLETIAIQRGGAQALVNSLEGKLPAAPAVATAAATASPEAADLHAEVRAIIGATVRIPDNVAAADDRIDRWALHPVIGPAILATVMFLVFQAVYALGLPLTDLIVGAVEYLGGVVGDSMADGPLKGLIVDGIFAGLGTVLGFLPQILVLFLFILILELSGYLPRAAFLLDRVMVAVGLTGRAFIPLLSSFACAIPSIIGTRSIPDRRDRLVTILVAPLMTCSARLPVYAVLIGAFIPTQQVLGIFNLQGIVLFALYVAGIAGAAAVAYTIKRMQRDRREHPLLMELPSYRIPKLRDLAYGLWQRGWIFLRRLTGVILALTVLMWFISAFPGPPPGATGADIEYSIAGHIGRFLAPIFAPLGFNWQISLSLIPAFAARETAVAALATVYSVADEGDALGTALATNFSLATALALMVWFVFAPQCMSTLAVMRRETGSWRVVAASFVYMFVLAYVAAFVTYRVALLWM